MQIYALLILSALLSTFSIWAQNPSVITSTSNAVTSIVTNPDLQTDLLLSQETSKLEDLNDINSCPSQLDTHESCRGFANSLVPQGYKDKGWKTLLEIKYQPIEMRQTRSLARSNYKFLNLNSYHNHDPETELKTADELNTEAQQVVDFYASNGVTIDIFDARTQLIIDQLTNPAYTKNDADMMGKIKTYSSSMNDQDFLRFVSAIAGYVDYSDERAAFEQTEAGGLGIATPFQQMMGTKLGVCGDIHSMAAKIVEQRGWEAFTVGYALEGAQHVVTAIVNPNDPKKLMIVNYGSYEEQTLNDGNSITATPTSSGWEEIGTQMRIFKNDKTGDPDGKMQQIATVPTALGSFMNSLFVKEGQMAKAMPQNQNFQSEVIGGQTTKNVTKIKNDGNKLTDKFIANGVLVYEGKIDNADIYGIAVSHDVYKDIYRWDETAGKCVLKKSKYFSIGGAASIIDLTQADFQNTFFAYLNMKGGQIFHVYQSEFFQFKGLIGYELEGFGSKYEDGFLTADGNLSTFLGVVADYKKDGTSVHLGLTYETNVGLRNQNLMTDLGSLPTNVNPLMFNAVSFDANVSHTINSSTTLVSNNNITMTRVGGRVFLSTGIIHNNTSVMLSYQGGFKPIPIGNTLQNINLLQNFNNMDGFKLTATQNFSNTSGNFSGSLFGSAGISTTTVKPQPMLGAGVKINLNSKKKRKPTGNF